MQALETGWSFFQNEVLGMKWLNRLIGSILEACGLDTSGRIGGSIRFFLVLKNKPCKCNSLVNLSTLKKQQYKATLRSDLNAVCRITR